MGFRDSGLGMIRGSGFGLEVLSFGVLGMRALGFEVLA